MTQMSETDINTYLQTSLIRVNEASKRKEKFIIFIEC